MQLISLGYKIDPSADCQLAASITTKQTKEVSFRTHAVGPGAGLRNRQIETHAYTPVDHNLTYSFQGSKIYEAGRGSGIPPMIQLKEGETITDYLRKYETIDYDYYIKVNLPKNIIKPVEPSVGKSRITVSGLVLEK